MSNFNIKKLNVFYKILISVIMAILVVGLFFAVPLLFNEKINTVEEEGHNNLKKPEIPISIQISCVGDIMIHEPQIPAQFDSLNNSYDFNNNFKYVKKYIEASDLAIGNFEGTFGGAPYKGYPAFSAPDELASALSETGFDLIITANNHMVDRGELGIKRTLEILRKEGLKTSGSRLDETQVRYSISRVKGVDIGLVSYTYETGGDENRVAINGTYIKEESAALINSFSYDTLDEDMGKIKEVIESAKAAGAEIIILYLHWGEEYETTPNSWQKLIVKTVADNMNVDIIFASHPHVLQETGMVYSKIKQREIPVFYSMGNFISNQRQETLENRYTEQGIIGIVNIKYMKTTAQIIDMQIDAIPTWVDRYIRDGKTVYEIIPLDEEFLVNPALIESGHLNRAKQALEDINGILKINR